MPFVLIHKKDRRIYSCPLINIYNLPYYGAKFWDSREEAEQEARQFLAAKNESSPDDWDLLEVEEHRLKVLNVKLGNNPARSVRIDEDGRAVGYERG